MTKLEFTGKVTVVGIVRTGTTAAGSNWASQQFVMEETDGRAPMSIAFDVFNDKVALSEGEICTVHLETRVSAKDGRYFTNIGAYRKDPISPAPAQPAQPAAPVAQSQPAPTAIPATDGLEPPF